MYYGMQISIPGSNIPGVQIFNGDTPFPIGAIFPVPLEVRPWPPRYLKIADGKIVVRTPEEKRLVDLPEKYRNPDGTEKTAEEKAAIDSAELQAALASQAAAEAAYKLVQAKLDDITPASIKALRDALIAEINLRLKDDPIKPDAIDTRMRDILGARI